MSKNTPAICVNGASNGAGGPNRTRTTGRRAGLYVRAKRESRGRPDPACRVPCVGGIERARARRQRWWKHVEYLASDQLEGRGTGTVGYQKAAGYVASQFYDAGLKPAGTQEYFQPVRFDVTRLDESRSSIALLNGDARIPVAIGPDAILGKRGETGSFEAEAVFAGYGLTIPEANYDDLRGLDLKGKSSCISPERRHRFPGHSNRTTNRSSSAGKF